ncbi:hypothetical protein [Saccharospirillum mangrovi]|uniref:hypothetical protein n=1 Tax=Saccharospirillum mangrovi TaxID=2161747 RepID=UPI000D3AF170|nr:hypothetical protein [Saccharospirillum mangrovi]
MIKQLRFSLAANILLTMLLCLVVFHLLLLVGVVPFDQVWGGRLNNTVQVRVFETISLVVTVLVMAVVAMKVGYLRPVLVPWLINAVLWVLVGLFLLNALGNLASTQAVETFVFTPVTMIAALLCYRLVIEPNA